MSEPTPDPRPRKYGASVLIILVALAMLAGIITFVLAQSGGSAAPPSVEPPSTSAPSEAPNETDITAGPTLSAEEQHTALLQREQDALSEFVGSEVETYDARGQFNASVERPGEPVPFELASAFTAAFNPAVPIGCSSYMTADGLRNVRVISNAPDAGMYGRLSC